MRTGYQTCLKYPVLYRLREFVEVPKVQIFALYEKKALSERSEFDFFSYALSKGMYLWYF